MTLPYKFAKVTSCIWFCITLNRSVHSILARTAAVTDSHSDNEGDSDNEMIAITIT